MALLLPVDTLLTPCSWRRGIPQAVQLVKFPSCHFCINQGDCSLWSWLQGMLCLTAIVSFLIKCFLSLSPEEKLKAVMIFKVGDPTDLLMQALWQKKCLK